MTTPATRIRDKIYSILTGLVTTTDFKTIRFTPVMMLQPDDLPAVSISLVGERLTPNGDDNTGGFAFDSEVTIGISAVRGFRRPHDLDADIDRDVDLIERMLLGNAEFTGFKDPYFEAVTGISRRRNYPQSGEAYFVEVRLEMTFRTSADFEILAQDDFQTLSVRARPAGTDEHTPAAGARVSLPTTTP